MINTTDIPQFAPESVSRTNDPELMQRQKQNTTTDTMDTLGYSDHRTVNHTGTHATTTQVSTGSLVPMAYTKNETGKLSISKKQERDPSVYNYVYDYADEIIRANLERCKTPAQKAHLYLFAITNAIALKIRPDQQQAEGRNEKLLEEASTVTTEEIEQHEAEVCTTKSLIAFEFLKQGYPQIAPALHLTADPNNKRGHMYLQVNIAGEMKEFYPNSPQVTTNENGQEMYQPLLK